MRFVDASRLPSDAEIDLMDLGSRVTSFPLSVLEERFLGVEEDLARLTVDELQFADLLPSRERDAYVAGFVQALKDVSEILQDRFSELKRKDNRRCE